MKTLLSVLALFVSLFTFSSISSACNESDIPTYDYVPYTVSSISHDTYSAADTQGNTITFTTGDIRQGDNIKPGDIVNALYDSSTISGLNAFLAIEKEYGIYSPDHTKLTYSATIEAYSNGYYQAFTDDMTQTIFISPELIKGKNIKLGDKVLCVFDAKEYKLIDVKGVNAQ